MRAKRMPEDSELLRRVKTKNIAKAEKRIEELTEKIAGLENQAKEIEGAAGGEKER